MSADRTVHQVPEQPWRRRVAKLSHIARSGNRLVLVGIIGSTLLYAVAGGLVALGLRNLLNGAIEDNSGVLAVGLALLAVGSFGNTAGTRVSTTLQAWASPELATAVSTETLSMLATTPTLAPLEQPVLADEIALVRDGGEVLARSTWAALDSIAVVVQFVFVAVLLGGLQPVLLLLPLFSLPQVLFASRVQRVIDRGDAAAAEASRAADRLHALFLDVDASMELRLFGAVQDVDDEASARWAEATAHKERAQVKAAMYQMLLRLPTALGLGLALGVVILGVDSGWASLGDLLLIIQVERMTRGQVQQASRTLTQVQGAMRTIDRALWLEDTLRVTPRSTTNDVPRTMAAGIELEHLSFQYPGVDVPVLRDLSMTFRAGTTVALVGLNGAGKSTLVKLLCRFYEPTSGRITVDGLNVATFDPVAWQARVSGAFQDFLKLETSVRESVGFADLAHLDDDAAITVAIEAGGFDSVLGGLPDGLDTHVGKTYRDGAQLSGGEWQRLAVARAMLRVDPLLLVLDEPTAALDPSAEYSLYQRYAAAAARTRRAGGVTVLISHRFSSVRMADEIAVIEGGALVEHGTHEQLLAEGGRYAELYEQQAAAYR